MHKLYSPETELDLTFIKSLLESENIPFFIHNDHFGSLKVGPKIDLLNNKTIFVSEADNARARELLSSYLKKTAHEEGKPTSKTAYSLVTKLRIIIEALIFGWFVPQGRRWKKETQKKQAPDKQPSL